MSAHPTDKKSPVLWDFPRQIETVTSIQVLLKTSYLLIRAHICPRKQLVVLRQRIPINHYELDAPLRNDAQHGLAADLESPKAAQD